MLYFIVLPALNAYFKSFSFSQNYLYTRLSQHELKNLLLSSFNTIYSCMYILKLKKGTLHFFPTTKIYNSTLFSLSSSRYVLQHHQMKRLVLIYEDFYQ